MTLSSRVTNDASWAGGLEHLAQLYTAMQAAPAGSCGAIKETMNELERTLGITYEAAVAKGLIAPAVGTPKT